LYEAVDDADLLAGNVNDFGCVILKEAAQHRHVAAQGRHLSTTTTPADSHYYYNNDYARTQLLQYYDDK